MQRTAEELASILNQLFPDNDSDEFLGLLEDIRDSVGVQHPQANDNDNQEDWKQKCEELDKSWRKRYRDTFMTGKTDPEFAKEQKEATKGKKDNEEEEKPLTIDNLIGYNK